MEAMDGTTFTTVQPSVDEAIDDLEGWLGAGKPTAAGGYPTKTNAVYVPVFSMPQPPTPQLPPPIAPASLNLASKVFVLWVVTTLGRPAFVHHPANMNMPGSLLMAHPLADFVSHWKVGNPGSVISWAFAAVQKGGNQYESLWQMVDPQYL